MTRTRLSGNLATMSLPDLLQWAHHGRKSGILAVRNGPLVKRIALAGGVIVGSSSNDPRDYLGQVLLSEGAITEQQLKEAMEFQARTGTMLGRILVQGGVVGEARIAAILRRKAEETIYSLFLWGDADFEFGEDETPAKNQVPISVPVESVLLEGLRRYDTARKIREVLPDDHLVLKHTSKPLPPELGTIPFPRRIYDLLDGRRTVADVVLEAHSSEFNVCQVLYVLVQRRYAAVVDAASAADPAPPLAPTASRGPGAETPEALIAAARSSLGRGEAEQALVLLDTAREAGARTPELDTLVQEAEKYFVERAYRFYLPPGKVPVLKRPLASLVGEPLSPEEVFLVSRVNGTWDLRSIMSISPLREVDALRALKRLRERGVIDLVEPGGQSRAA